jgi:hypothetical protein
VFIEPDKDTPNFDLELKLVDERGGPVKDAKGADIAAQTRIQASPENTNKITVMIPLVLSLAPGLQLNPGVYKWELTSPEFPNNTWTRPFEVRESTTKEGSDA